MKIPFFYAVIIVPFAGLDMWGMLHCISKTDFIRMTLKTLESYLSLATTQGRKYGQEAAKVVCIMDMENFSIRQYAWKPGKYQRILTSTGVTTLQFTLMTQYEVNTIHTEKNKKAAPFRAEIYQIFV
jgi:hypothetical protein